MALAGSHQLSFDLSARVQIKFSWMRVRVHDPLIPVLIPDQVDQGYWVIRSQCESASKVPGV